jgi:uncharacterized protein YbaR (Trm112 family)
MKPSILEHIICPTCRSDFKLLTKSKLKNEIKEGTLICTKCNHKFKITKGIPRFVVDMTKDFGYAMDVLLPNIRGLYTDAFVVAFRKETRLTREEVIRYLNKNK